MKILFYYLTLMCDAQLLDVMLKKTRHNVYGNLGAMPTTQGTASLP